MSFSRGLLLRKSPAFGVLNRLIRPHRMDPRSSRGWLVF